MEGARADEVGVGRAEGDPAALVVEAPRDSGSRVNAALAEQKMFASELMVSGNSLEKVFLHLTGGESSD